MVKNYFFPVLGQINLPPAGQCDTSVSVSKITTGIQAGAFGSLAYSSLSPERPPQEPVGTKGPWVPRSSDQEKINPFNKETLFAL